VLLERRLDCCGAAKSSVVEHARGSAGDGGLQWGTECSLCIHVGGFKMIEKTTTRCEWKVLVVEGFESLGELEFD